MSTGETTEGNTAQARRLQLPVPTKIEILKHAPGEILVVNKPVDIRMNGDHDVTVESLIHKTLDNEKYKKLKWIHRLDMATSGVLVIGLSKKISAVFHDLFDGRLSQKCYVALLRGHLKRKEAWKSRSVLSLCITPGSSFIHSRIVNPRNFFFFAILYPLMFKLSGVAIYIARVAQLRRMRVSKHGGDSAATESPEGHI